MKGGFTGSGYDNPNLNKSEKIAIVVIIVIIVSIISVLIFW